MKHITESKLLSLSLILGSTLVSLHSPSAFAGKLDLASVQGKYAYVATPDTSIACPESITVTYDAANGTFDSEIFHFANIGKGAPAPGAIETDADSASYSDTFAITKLKSHSILSQTIDQTTTSDLSEFSMATGPMDAINPGSPESMNLSDTQSVTTTEVKCDAKTRTLKKTVDVDGMNTGDNCAYQKI
jgi:hypothetical protein